MALDESGKDYLNKVLTGADALLAVGATAVGSNNLANLYITGHSVVMNSTKNYVGEQNSYRAIGKAVGDTVLLVGVGEILGLGKFLGMTSKMTLMGAASVEVNEQIFFEESSFAGGIFATAFDTYVRNADEFYTRIATDESYREDVKNELSSMFSSNYLNQIGNYYSNITFDDFWEDIKDIYSPPPASGQGSLVYNQLTSNPNHLSIQTSDIPIQVEVVKSILNDTTINTLNLNNKNLKVADLTNLELRNAIDGIDKVSFLLSNITIYVGEKLDLGSHGIYEVQSGDTLSVIAQNLNDGTVTKDLVKLNPWLFDAGRIHFNYPDKVLIAAGTAIDSTQDHVLEGDANAANILKDSNGGNDTLIGGSQEDYLYGGIGEDILQGEGGDDYLHGGNDAQIDTLLGESGFDTYVARDGDIIYDSDHDGQVWFANHFLRGGVYDSNERKYLGDGGVYSLSGSDLVFEHPLYGTLTITGYSRGFDSLGIELTRPGGGDEDPNDHQDSNNDEDNEDNEEDNEDITQVNLSVSSASASESAGYMNFVVTLSQALEADLSFNFSTPNGSATTGSDFYGSGGAGVISAGSTQLTISVFLLDDDEHEETEHFSLTLSNIQTTAQNVSVVYAGDVTGTITDDDPDEDDRDDDDKEDQVCTYQDGSWHLKMNNKDFKSKSEVA